MAGDHPEFSKFAFQYLHSDTQEQQHSTSAPLAQNLPGTLPVLSLLLSIQVIKEIQAT